MNYFSLPYYLYLTYYIYSFDLRLITLIICCYQLNQNNTSYITNLFLSQGGINILNSNLIIKALPRQIFTIIVSIILSIYLYNQQIPYIHLLLTFHMMIVIISDICLLTSFIAIYLILHGLIALYNVNYGEKNDSYLIRFIENKLQDDEFRLQCHKYILIINHYLIRFTKFKFISEVIIDRNYLVETDSNRFICRCCEKQIDTIYYKLKCQHTYHSECLRKWIIEEDYCKVCEVIL